MDKVSYFLSMFSSKVWISWKREKILFVASIYFSVQRVKQLVSVASSCLERKDWTQEQKHFWTTSFDVLQSG